MSHIKKITSLSLAALWLTAMGAPQASADTAFTGEKWVDSLKFSGDLRIRHEGIYFKQAVAGNNDENRQRIRFRWGGTANIQDFLVGFRLASGVGQQVLQDADMAVADREPLATAGQFVRPGVEAKGTECIDEAGGHQGIVGSGGRGQKEPYKSANTATVST